MVENVTNAVETTENIVVNYRKGYKYILSRKKLSPLKSEFSHIIMCLSSPMRLFKKFKLLLAYHQIAGC